MNLFKKLAAVILSVCIFTSIFYLSTHLCHECSGTDCDICHINIVCVSLLINLSYLSFFARFSISNKKENILLSYFVISLCFINITLVSLKKKLSS